MPSENLTLYAKWDIAQHNVIFQYLNEDNTTHTTIDTQTILHNQAAKEPTNTSRDGYRFDGWDKEFSKIVEDITVTAQYTSYPVSYTHLDVYKRQRL